MSILIQRNCRGIIALFGIYLTKVNLSWFPSKRWVGHANSCHLERKPENARTKRLFKNAKTRFSIFTFASNRLLHWIIYWKLSRFVIQAHKTGSTICGCTPFGFSHLLMYEVHKIIWMQPFTTSKKSSVLMVQQKISLLTMVNFKKWKIIKIPWEAT